MFRVAPFITPAWMPAFLFASALALPGCSLLPGRQEPPASVARPVGDAGGDAKPAKARDAFSVEVKAPDAVRDHLIRHLELQRYRQIDDLGSAELSRLMVAAEANARELLGTLGYFAPTLTLELRDTPDAAAPREVLITVEPGEPALVKQVEIGFAGAVADDPSACLLYTSPSPRDGLLSRMPSSA